MTVDRAGVVLFVHEAGGDRWTVLPYLEFWQRAGYDVFAFDFEQSDQGSDTLNQAPRPWITQSQVDDVLAGIDFLYAQAKWNTNDDYAAFWGVTTRQTWGGRAAANAVLPRRAKLSFDRVTRNWHVRPVMSASVRATSC
jgi:hypothetical protein